MILALLAVMNAECRTYCLSQYESGFYKDSKCICTRSFDYETSTQKITPKRLPTNAEHPIEVYDD